MHTLDSGATPTEPCRESFRLVVVFFFSCENFGEILLERPLFFFIVLLAPSWKGLRHFALVRIEWVI
jgi:hypothetical protein